MALFRKTKAQDYADGFALGWAKGYQRGVVRGIEEAAKNDPLIGHFHIDVDTAADELAAAVVSDFLKTKLRVAGGVS